MRRSFPLVVAVVYGLVGTLWIVLSRRLPWLLTDDSTGQASVSIPKGAIFIALMSLMLYGLIKGGISAMMRRGEKACRAVSPFSSEAIEQMENALAESEKRLQDILNRAPSVIYVKDLQGRYDFVNRHFERLSGFRKKEVLGRTDFDLFPRDVAVQSAANDQKALEMANPLETEETAPVGSEMHTFISAKFPLFDPHGDAYALCGISTDINARKRAEMERERLIGQLQDALAKVKLLSGFLPICASCKKIRDDRGYWQQIEAYIREHSEAEFSHGLCPDCVRKFYDRAPGPAGGGPGAED